MKNLNVNHEPTDSETYKILYRLGLKMQYDTGQKKGDCKSEKILYALRYSTIHVYFHTKQLQELDETGQQWTTLCEVLKQLIGKPQNVFEQLVIFLILFFHN